MATPLGGERSNAREDARARALAVELGAQLGRLKGAGPKIRQILSMVQLDRATEGERSLPALGALPDGARAVPFGRARRVIEQDLDAGVRELFADVDEQRVHDGLSRLGYLRQPQAFDRHALLEHLATAGEWMLAHGFRRVDPAYVTQILDRGYPPRSPRFALMRRLRMPPPTLLLRRMEIQVLALLGALHAVADWGAITAEHHSGKPASTALGREDHAFHRRRARP